MIINQKNSNIQRLIAKIDNDFNPDNSDWIPRVGAWAIDAMQQLNCLPTERKKVKVKVTDRIAYSNCPIDGKDIKVYDENGCEVKELNEAKESCDGCKSNNPSTGDEQETVSAGTSNTSITITDINKSTANYVKANTVNDKTPYRWNVEHYKYGDENSQSSKNYVISGNCQLELNWDAKYIYIECEYIKTIEDSRFGCQLPVIPNNGLLLEAITYYCMWKMLTRGYKHPVFNLAASQYGTNPYYQWEHIKEEAKRSVINDGVDAKLDSHIFRSNFYIETFDPRH